MESLAVAPHPLQQSTSLQAATRFPALSGKQGFGGMLRFDSVEELMLPLAAAIIIIDVTASCAA